MAATRSTPASTWQHWVSTGCCASTSSIAARLREDPLREIFDAIGAELALRLRYADAATYRAKAEGRDSAHFFTPDLNEPAERRLLPIDRLKIDRAFVSDRLDDLTGLAIIRAIIGLGHPLDPKGVAEGVEQQRRAALRRQAGCDELQGGLFARPWPAEGLLAWLAGRGATPPLRSGVTAELFSA